MNIAQFMQQHSNSAHSVHSSAEAIRTITNDVQSRYSYYLDWLNGCEGGFSPETLAMIRLEADAKALRTLADRMDAVRAKLTADQ